MSKGIWVGHCSIANLIICIWLKHPPSVQNEAGEGVQIQRANSLHFKTYANKQLQLMAGQTSNRVRPLGAVMRNPGIWNRFGF